MFSHMKYIKSSGLCTAAIVLSVVMAVLDIPLIIQLQGLWRLFSIVMLLALAILIVLLNYLRPKLNQYDTATSSLLAQEHWGSDAFNPNSLPPLNLMIDEVLTEEKLHYQQILVQNQNSLAVLQNQINPHFLYNTLDCIRGEALDAGMDNIASMVEALSAFFRYSISTSNMLVQLRDELRNIKIYYQIQQYRFKNRFSLEIECEDERALDCYLPKLTLQPIVENCILHGLEAKEADGIIKIHVILTDKRLIITVSDNGCGISPNELARLQDRLESDEVPDYGRKVVRHGIAMKNINLQLKLIFGQNYGLSISSQLDVGTETEIQIPSIYRLSDIAGNEVFS